VRNAEPYLDERIRSIRDQTVTDCEVVVVDGFSSDGSWEKVQAWAAEDPRVRLYREVPAGVYQAFNRCIELSRGEYVYIATSDDTMSPDCLEKLVNALERHPKCGLAHCGAEFIDEESQPSSFRRWEDWPQVQFFGDLMNREHIRPRGHDTVLAFALKTPYYSTTQLLVRRELFGITGPFKTLWGSFGDLEWQMRAALVAPTIHVPQKLATWRIHGNQASQVDPYRKAIRDGWFVEMANSVISFSKKHGLPRGGGLPRRLSRFFKVEQAASLWSELSSRQQKGFFLLRLLLTDHAAGRLFLKERLRNRTGLRSDMMANVRHELSRLGIQPASVCVAAEETARYEDRRLA